MAKAFRKIGFIFVVVVLIFTLLAVLFMNLFGYQLRAVTTGSMEPEIPVGSLLLISKTSMEDLKIGDDITFVRDKNLTVVTHRIVSLDKENEIVTTQGIANNVIDAPTNYENILGKVIFKVPIAGYLFSWLDSTVGKIIAVTAVVSIVIIWILIDVIVGYNKKAKADESKNNII